MGGLLVSLRSGGSKSLPLPDVSLQDIRRFRRWEPTTSHEYLRFADLQYRHISALMANSAGLADQHLPEADKTDGIRFPPNQHIWSR